MFFKLPSGVAISVISALAGGAASRVLFLAADPDVKALLKRQFELAEQHETRRLSAQKVREDFFKPMDVRTSGGQKMGAK